MEWSNVTLWSVISICTTVIIGFIIKCAEKSKMSKLSFEQSKTLEDKKQANALELIKKRKPEINQEPIDALNKKMSELEEKIKEANDQTKNELEKAKAQIEIYEKFLNKKA
ncbi:MAG: hypothetical protein M9888_00585 [Chitinophagales bacterium]|nr:hypothetical protein [Chitinophagales bacterium]